MLRASGADFVARFSDMRRVRSMRRQLPGYDPEIQRKMIDSGWFGLLVPEAFGGFGGSFADMAGLVEELGRGLVAEPLVASAVLVARTLAHCSESELTREQLAYLIRGDTALALAWQGPAGGLAFTEANVIAQMRNGAVVLDGAAYLVAGAGCAAAFIVFAQSDKGRGIYLVEKNQPGLAVTHEWRVDGTPMTSLALTAVELPSNCRLACGEQVTLALSRAVDETLVIVAAELLGVMTAAFELTLGYLRTRVQFGKPIGSFQALQHRMVDQYVQLRLASASIDDAVQVLDTHPSIEGDIRQRQLAASRVKARCSDAALKITREAIQLHGAMGFTDECDAGLYLKRALALSAWLGNASQHKRRYAALSYDLSVPGMGPCEATNRAALP